MTWQFRKAMLDDLDGIMRIENATFPEDAWSEATMRSELESRNSYYLVGFDPTAPDHLVAYAGLSLAKGATQADIQTIAVEASLQGKGIGGSLIRQLISEARVRGAAEVFLEVRADNEPAIGLYRNLGFEAIATRRGYYQPAGIDAIVMRLEVVAPTSSFTEWDRS
ncbi:MAG: ribosomal protein S18-alanine N-acetyltransferase [Microbacteriaceae bacterium]|nr:ribosomal protein S18-alanine N-acetyltransferase [Microbacteriaceae bacterium]